MENAYENYTHTHKQTSNINILATRSRRKMHILLVINQCKNGHNIWVKILHVKNVTRFACVYAMGIGVHVQRTD